MEFIQTDIPEVIIVKPTVIQDYRGYFMESYHLEKYKQGGIASIFVQDNYARSIHNTLRGMHFQLKFPQAKLLQCMKGKIFDVAVDIRKDSPYFCKWVSQELTEDNKLQMYIPEGFAHGYYAMSESVEIVYKCSELHHPEDEQGILWNDPSIGIEWPSRDPILSDKDQKLPTLQKLMGSL